MSNGAVEYEIVCADTSKISRPEWLDLRRPGLGASDVAPAMGMSPWQSQYSLWAEKSGLLPGMEQTERFEWALKQEPLIIQWAEDHGWVHGPVRRFEMARSVSYPWLLANPDGVTKREVVEVKHLHSGDETRWDYGVPDHYVIQTHAQMIVYGVRTAVMPVTFGCDPPRHFIIDFDPVLAAQIIETTHAFWKRVESGDAPDPDGSEASMNALREVYMNPEQGKKIELPPEAEAWLDKRDIAVIAEKAFTKQVNEVKAQIMFEMGDAEIATIFDEPVATWKTNKAGNRVFLFKNRQGSAE